MWCHFLGPHRVQYFLLTQGENKLKPGGFSGVSIWTTSTCQISWKGIRGRPLIIWGGPDADFCEWNLYFLAKIDWMIFYNMVLQGKGFFLFLGLNCLNKIFFEGPLNKFFCPMPLQMTDGRPPPYILAFNEHICWLLFSIFLSLIEQGNVKVPIPLHSQTHPRPESALLHVNMVLVKKDNAEEKQNVV